MSSRRWVLPVVLVFLLVAATVAVQRIAARQYDLSAPTLSRQVAAAPPLANVVQDQGNTVPLPDGRTLWIFADTAHLDAKPTFFVTSAAGVSARGGLQLTYLSAFGTPVEFLPRTAAERADQVIGQHYSAVWPTGATVLPDGRVLIAYAKYRVQLQPQPAFTFVAGGLYSYSYTGLSKVGLGGTATRIADDIWNPLDGPVASPVYADGYVYFLRCPEYKCYSARTTPAGLADRLTYRWWTGSGWGSERAAAKALSFGSDVPGRNPAVAYDPQREVFVMTDTSGGIQDGTGKLWVARHPWGPWSDAASFPLPQCPSGGCYTLNPHPLDSPPGMIRISFATNGLGPFVRVVDVPVAITGSGDPSVVTSSTGT